VACLSHLRYPNRDVLPLNPAIRAACFHASFPASLSFPPLDVYLDLCAVWTLCGYARVGGLLTLAVSLLLVAQRLSESAKNIAQLQARFRTRAPMVSMHDV